MTLDAREAYLQTQVLSAPPWKLRLMLIEAAIRFVQQGQQHWQEDRATEALEAFVRAREIIAELMASLSPDKSPLAKQILPIYSYLFRTLTEAQWERSAAKLADVLRILGEERETWRLACEKFAAEANTTSQAPLPPASTVPPPSFAVSPPALRCSFEA